MNRLQSIIARIAGLTPKARYEGAQRSDLRTFVPVTLQPARLDADAATRETLVAKARYFERNSAFLQRLTDLFEQYVVGSGLNLFAASSDPEWNRRADAYFDAWKPFCDLASLQHWTTLQALIARAWFIDGEVFILKTSGSTGNPRIQLIESHRCKTPSTVPKGKTIVDGVEVDSFGRPVAYWFQTDTIETDGYAMTSWYAWSSLSGKAAKFERVPAEFIIHHFEPSRPGQVRGLPFCYAVINTLHDLDDLEAFEMRAAKSNAAVEKVIKTATGEVTDDDIIRGTVTGTDGVDRAEYYRQVFGAEAKVLKHGDEFGQFGGERPSERTAAYWDYLVGKVCIGVGIPAELVRPTSMQGTSQRAMLDVAAAWFRIRSSVLGQTFGRVYEFVIWYGVERDGLLRGAPADWRAFSFVPPKGPDVDAGRNSAAMIAEYKAGMRTLQSIYGQSGEQWKKELRQRADEIAEAKRLADERGLDRAEVLALDPNELSSNNAAGTEPPTNPTT